MLAWSQWKKCWKVGPRDDGCSWLPVESRQALSWTKDMKRATEGSTAIMNKRDWRSRGEGQILQAR